AAIAAGQEGLEIAQSAQHRYSEVWVRYGLGYAHIRQGNFAAATRVLEPGLALCRGMDLRVALPFVAGSLGSAYLSSGRPSDAVPSLEEAVEALTAVGIFGMRSLFITFLGEAYLFCERLAEAAQRADEAVALTRACQQRGWEAWALRLRGAVCAFQNGGSGEAKEAYQHALSLATELGMRPLAAHCHLGLGRLPAKVGESEDMAANLARAMALYREMDM